MMKTCLMMEGHSRLCHVQSFLQTLKKRFHETGSAAAALRQEMRQFSSDASLHNDETLDEDVRALMVAFRKQMVAARKRCWYYSFDCIRGITPCGYAEAPTGSRGGEEVVIFFLCDDCG